jgi:hypothetical protein
MWLALSGRQQVALRAGRRCPSHLPPNSVSSGSRPTRGLTAAHGTLSGCRPPGDARPLTHPPFKPLSLRLTPRQIRAMGVRLERCRRRNGSSLSSVNSRPRRRADPYESTKSNSTAIACRRGSRTAPSNSSPARASTGPPNVPRQPLLSRSSKWNPLSRRRTLRCSSGWRDIVRAYAASLRARGRRFGLFRLRPPRDRRRKSDGPSSQRAKEPPGFSPYETDQRNQIQRS